MHDDQVLPFLTFVRTFSIPGFQERFLDKGPRVHGMRFVSTAVPSNSRFPNLIGRSESCEETCVRRYRHGLPKVKSREFLLSCCHSLIVLVWVIQCVTFRHSGGNGPNICVYDFDDRVRCNGRKNGMPELTRHATCGLSRSPIVQFLLADLSNVAASILQMFLFESAS